MARRDRNVFTIMIVPHAETKVFTFRLSTLAFQAICYGFVCLFLFMMILARSYQTMAANMWELEELRLVNREQREQIEQLVKEARALQERMMILDELDKQVREMMKLESYDADDHSVALSSFPGGGSDTGLAVTASMGGIGGGRLPQAGGVGVVSRKAIQDALRARSILESIDREMTVRSQSLHELRRLIAENMSYMAARPSIWPAHGFITSYYGYRFTVYGYEHHDGIDISGRVGTPIVATADGTVVFAGWNGLYGRTVVIDHGYGWSTLYGHCAKLAVELGDRVKRGEVIGFIGSTGKSTGPHVHFEVRVNGRTVNPRYYLGGN